MDDFEREIHADGGSVMLGEELVDVSLDDARLAHTQLSNHQNLEQILLTLGHRTASHAAAAESEWQLLLLREEETARQLSTTTSTFYPPSKVALNCVLVRTGAQLATGGKVRGEPAPSLSLSS